MSNKELAEATRQLYREMFRIALSACGTLKILATQLDPADVKAIEQEIRAQVRNELSILETKET